MKAVNKPGPSACLRGLVPRNWLQHHEETAIHEPENMHRLTPSELPAAGYSLGGRQGETLLGSGRRPVVQSQLPNHRGWMDQI